MIGEDWQEGSAARIGMDVRRIRGDAGYRDQSDSMMTGEERDEQETISFSSSPR